MRKQPKTTVCLVLALLGVASCCPENTFVADETIKPLPVTLCASEVLRDVTPQGDTLTLELTESGRLLYGRIPADAKMAPAWTYYSPDELTDTLSFPEMLGGRGVEVIPVHKQESVILAGVKDGEYYYVPYVDRGDILTANLCRGWHVDQTLIKVRISGGQVGARFTGCDLAEILDYAAARGADVRRLRGSSNYGSLIEKAIEIRENRHDEAKTMVVDDLTFTANGTFIVGFRGRAPYVGTWHWLEKRDAVFACDFVMDGDEGEAVRIATTGQVLFRDTTCDITIDATFTSDGRPYEATADFFCSAI